MIESNPNLALVIDRDELFKALEKSVDLQSHYASLLNQYDGGERIVFKTVMEWIERLRMVGLKND